MIAFFSLWEIRFLMVRVCVSVYCLHVHVLYVYERVCACVCVRMCVSPLLWITSMYALHVCVLYARLGVSGASVLLVCFFYCIWACMSVCVVTLAPVVRLHDSRYSYGVLLCADAWPVWESETVSVRYDCVCLWSNSRPRLWEFLMLSSLRQEMLHNALNVPFQLWISGIIWFRYMISLECTRL